MDESMEFQFKLLSRLRFFGENEAPPLKQPLNLVVAISKFGLVCVGTSNGFDVVETAKIVEQLAGAKKPTAEVTNFPRRRIVLGVQPSHLDVSCDFQYLAVGFATAGGNAIRVYNVTSFMAQSEQVVSEVRVPAPLQALSWNPGIPNLLATCLQDCSACVYEFKNNSFDISSIPPDSQSTCLCWSPKGKQIVIGLKNGSINQFKPDLKIVRTIPPQSSGESVVSVQWLSSIQYAAIYCRNGMDPCLVLVNTPKGQPITYTGYADMIYSNGNNRVVEFYFIHQQTWNVLLVGSSNSTEVGVLGMQGSDWKQWTHEDADRGELPLSATKKDTHPIGMALDTSVHHTLPWGDNQQLPSMPLLLILSHEGLLSLYWSLNLMQGVVSICAPPTPLPDTSGLHLFTVPTQPSENLTLEELREKYQLLLDIARCAICLESVRKEKVQCVNGHLLCSDCKADLKICPTCDEEFSSSKPSHFISQVIAILPTRCKYRNCPTILRKYDDHEKYCGFKPTKCKLCTWEGPGKDILCHCECEHGGCSTVSDDRSWSNFKIDVKISLFTAWGSFCKNLFFWEQTINDPDTEIVTLMWHLVPNGKPIDDFDLDDFFVTLSFKSKSGPFTTTKIKLNTDPDAPSEDNSISVPHRLLSYFMDEDSNLNYSVFKSVEYYR